MMTRPHRQKLTRSLIRHLATCIIALTGPAQSSETLLPDTAGSIFDSSVKLTLSAHADNTAAGSCPQNVFNKLNITKNLGSKQTHTQVFPVFPADGGVEQIFVTTIGPQDPLGPSSSSCQIDTSVFTNDFLSQPSKELPNLMESYIGLTYTQNSGTYYPLTMQGFEPTGRVGSYQYCDAGKIDSTVTISSSQFTMLWGSDANDNFWLIDVEDYLSSFGSTSAGGATCKFEYLFEFNHPNFIFLGTETYQTDRAIAQGTNEVSRVALYYKYAGECTVPGDSTYSFFGPAEETIQIVVGTSATIPIKKMTPDPLNWCSDTLEWVYDGAPDGPIEEVDTTYLGKLSVDTSGTVVPLYDVAIYPTIVLISTLPLDTPIQVYKLTVRNRRRTSAIGDPAVYQSASYTIFIDVRSTCSVAMFAGVTQPTQPTSPITFDFISDVSYQTFFNTDKDTVGCPSHYLTYTCRSVYKGSDIVTPLVNSCEHIDVTTGQLSFFNEDSVSTEFPGLWSAYGTQATRTTMTSIAKGTYELTITGTNPENTDLVSPDNSVQHTFTVNVIDPCETTTFSIDVLPDLQVVTDNTPETGTLGVTDTATTAKADPTFCGDRIFSVLLPSPQPDWLQLDPNTGDFTIQTDNTSYNELIETVTLEVGLTEYPTAPKGNVSFVVTFTKACSQVVFQPDDVSTVVLTSLRDDQTFTFDPLKQQDYSEIFTSFVEDTLLDCGLKQVTWKYTSTSVTVPTDLTGTFFSHVPNQIGYEPNNESRVDIYTLYYRLEFVDYPDVNTGPHHAAFALTVYDRCSIAGGLVITPPAAQTLVNYFNGDVSTFNQGLFTLSGSEALVDYAANCPIKSIDCQIEDGSGNIITPCNQVDPLGTTITTFDTTTLDFTFQSPQRLNDLLPHDQTVQVHVSIEIGQVGDVFPGTSFTNTLTLPCMLSQADFQPFWSVEVFEVDEFIVKSYYVNWPGYNPEIVVEPFAGITDPKPYDVFLNGNTCEPIVQVQYNTRMHKQDPAGVESQTPVTQSFLFSDSRLVLDNTLQAGSRADLFTWLEFDNLWHEDQLNQMFPYVQRQMNYVDGHQYLELDTYTQVTPVLLDLAEGSSVLTVTSPLFKETQGVTLDTGIQLMNPASPLKKVTVYVEGVDPEKLDEILTFDVITTEFDTVEIELFRSFTNPVDKYNVVVCFSYGDLANLADLCDEQVVHPIINGRGTCFAQFQILVDSAVKSSMESLPFTTTIGNAAFEIVDLDSISMLILEGSGQVDNSVCGNILFKLTDEALASLVTLEPTGLLTFNSIQDSALVGTYTVTFQAYLSDIDPTGNFAKLLDLVLTLEVLNPVQDVSAEIAESLTSQAPISKSAIAPGYAVQFGQTEYLSFEFSSMIVEGDEADSGNINIRVVENTLVGLVSVSQIQYMENGVGTITLQADGPAALALAQELADATESDSGSVYSLEDIIGSITIEVEDLNKAGAKSSFQISINFVDLASSDPTEALVESEEESAEAAMVLLFDQQNQKLGNLFDNALNRTSSINKQDDVEEIIVEALLREISPVGQIYVDFTPKVVAVPNDWQSLWSQYERDQLASVDREVFEREVLKIMHATFVQNSDELPQQYVISNLTEFNAGGIEIQLNFSDPLLVSAGEVADRVRVKLLKSFFLVPDYGLAKGFTRSLSITRQFEDDEYIIIEHDLPMQIKSVAELKALEQTAVALENLLSSGFALTFLLNLLLSGVMSQLWNIFNTLQIILALPLLSVVMPANVVFVKQVVDGIINFQILKKETIRERIIEPMFGPSADSKVKTDTEKDSPQETSLLVQMAQLLLTVIAGLLLIAMLVYFKVKLLPRCCSCFQKLVNFALAKLMFNSLLRALMQTYLVNCISLWFNFTKIDLSSSNGIVDFCLAILTLLAAIFFPVFCWKFLKRKFEVLREPAFKMKYDSIYQNLEYYNVKALANTSFFLARRLLFAAVIVFCGSSLVLQVLLADILSTSLIAYYIVVRPVNSSAGNFIQILNELVVLYSVWTMFHFSAYVPDPEVRYELAYIFLYVMAADVAVNVLFLLYTLIKKIYLGIRNFFARRKAKKLAEQRIQTKELSKPQCQDNANVCKELDFGKLPDEHGLTEDALLERAKRRTKLTVQKSANQSSNSSESVSQSASEQQMYSKSSSSYSSSDWSSSQSSQVSVIEDSSISISKSSHQDEPRFGSQLIKQDQTTKFLHPNMPSVWPRYSANSSESHVGEEFDFKGPLGANNTGEDMRRVARDQKDVLLDDQFASIEGIARSYNIPFSRDSQKMQENSRKSGPSMFGDDNGGSHSPKVELVSNQVLDQNGYRANWDGRTSPQVELVSNQVLNMQDSQMRFPVDSPQDQEPSAIQIFDGIRVPGLQGSAFVDCSLGVSRRDPDPAESSERRTFSASSGSLQQSAFARTIQERFKRIPVGTSVIDDNHVREFLDSVTSNSRSVEQLESITASSITQSRTSSNVSASPASVPSGVSSHRTGQMHSSFDSQTESSTSSRPQTASVSSVSGTERTSNEQSQQTSSNEFTFRESSESSVSQSERSGSQSISQTSSQGSSSIPQSSSQQSEDASRSDSSEVSARQNNINMGLASAQQAATLAFQPGLFRNDQRPESTFFQGSLIQITVNNSIGGIGPNNGNNNYRKNLD